MHYLDRDGVLVPMRIGGHPALDLCNTRAGWEGPLDPRGEWLRDYTSLVAWAGNAELLTPQEEQRLRRRGGPASVRVLSDTRRLRTLLHSAVLDPGDADALAGVTGYVRRAAASVRLRPGTEPSWDVAPASALELPLLRAAWSAGQLLTSGHLGRVRACPGHDCGWLFLDRSGRRRWCAMSSCGNRAKVRAHAARHR